MSNQENEVPGPGHRDPATHLNSDNAHRDAPHTSQQDSSWQGQPNSFGPSTANASTDGANFGTGNGSQPAQPFGSAHSAPGSGQGFNSLAPGNTQGQRSASLAQQPGGQFQPQQYPDQTTQAPAAPRPFHAPQRTGDFRPTEQRIARDVGAPIALIVIAAIAAFGLAVLAGLGNPKAFFIGTIPSVIGLAIGLGTYLWLDRWEPEPPRLLLAAFLWGGGVSTVGALLIGLMLSLIGLNGQFFGAVIQAPIVEEALKAGWLFIMLGGARRREMNTLTDHLVYAGFCAFGFAFVENLLYFASADSMEAIYAMAIIRTGVNLFGHALYTSATAIGIYYARKGTDKLKVGPVIGGYLVAVLLHALWNGSAFFGIEALGLVYLVLLVPAFGYVVRTGLNARKSEGEVVGRQLDRMVYEGIVSQQDAAWLRQLESRKQTYGQNSRKTPEGKRARDVADAVTELSIVRERLATMTEPSPFLIEEERYLSGALYNESGRFGGGQPLTGGQPGQPAQFGQSGQQLAPNQPGQTSQPGQASQPGQTSQLAQGDQFSQGGQTGPWGQSGQSLSNQIGQAPSNGQPAMGQPHPSGQPAPNNQPFGQSGSQPWQPGAGDSAQGQGDRSSQ